ncbi:MAG: DPP IV N-terminal domain-containing protein [Bryobacteraceae bacterium]
MPTASAGPDDRLDSWKEIAAYLKKGVRTVQRWEQSNGLPVHRLELDRRGSVYAYKTELDEWWTGKQSFGTNEPNDELPDVADLPEAARGELEKTKPFPRILGARIGLAVIGISCALVLFALFAWAGFVRLETTPVSLNPIPLTSDVGDEFVPSFSPDGERVAYCARSPNGDDWRIYVKSISTDSVRRLTQDSAREVAPAWSPDGATIAFERLLGPGSLQIVLIPSSGKGSERILATLAGADRLAWSPDSKSIVLGGGSVKDESRIISVNVTTGTWQTITSPPEHMGDFDPAVAPDSSSIVFVRDLGPTSELYELKLTKDFKPDGAPKQITYLHEATRTPVFTPGGNSIVFASGVNGETAPLYLLSKRRSWFSSSWDTPKLLWKTDGHCLFPAVSAHHNRLAFALVQRTRIDTWRLNVTPDLRPSGSPVRLISSTHTDYNAQYSPDGQQIVFHSTRSGDSEIWLSDANGGNTKRLTNFKAPITGAPRWSPDQQWIVFDSNKEGQFEVYRVRPTGGEPERLTFSPGVDGVPSYSHDGKFIYFVSDRSGKYQIWKMDADGREQKQITRNGGYLAWESDDGRYLVYSLAMGMSPIYRVPVDGGTEEQLLPRAQEFNFFPVPGGVLFSKDMKTIDLLNFKTRRISTLFKPAQFLEIGLTVSNDRRHLLFSQGSGEGSDLMLVENFREGW